MPRYTSHQFLPAIWLPEPKSTHCSIEWSDRVEKINYLLEFFFRTICSTPYASVVRLFNHYAQLFFNLLDCFFFFVFPSHGHKFECDGFHLLPNNLHRFRAKELIGRHILAIDTAMKEDFKSRVNKSRKDQDNFVHARVLVLDGPHQ